MSLQCCPQCFCCSQCIGSSPRTLDVFVTHNKSFGSRFPKSIWFDFENKFTGFRARCRVLIPWCDVCARQCCRLSHCIGWITQKIVIYNLKITSFSGCIPNIFNFILKKKAPVPVSSFGSPVHSVFVISYWYDTALSSDLSFRQHFKLNFNLKNTFFWHFLPMNINLYEEYQQLSELQEQWESNLVKRTHYKWALSGGTRFRNVHNTVWFIYYSVLLDCFHVTWQCGLAGSTWR